MRAPLTAVLFGLLGCRSAAEAPDRPRALVWVTVDTLRADHLETYGYQRPTSPGLRAFGAGGAVFEGATSHVPWTKPSVATLVSSTLPSVHGVFDWPDALPSDLATVATALSAAGFRNEAYTVQMAFDPRRDTFHLGFDTFDSSLWLGVGHPIGLVTSEALTDQALDALATLEPPFFLWVHYFDPHRNYVADPAHPFGDAVVDIYDSEVAHTDEHVARLLGAVGDRDDVLVAFNADHGEEFEEHGGTGHTTTLYEELVRVPLVLAGPGILPQRVPGRVPLIDVAPTLLSLLGVPIPASFDGQRIPLRNGRFVPKNDGPIFLESRRWVDLRGVLHENWKLVRNQFDGTLLLYDLGNDPHEQTDLAASEPARRDALASILDEHYGAVP